MAKENVLSCRACLFAVKMISFDLLQLSLRLFSAADAWIWAISWSCELELDAGTTKYVSSANLTILLPVVRGWRSAAMTMYDAGAKTGAPYDASLYICN